MSDLFQIEEATNFVTVLRDSKPIFTATQVDDHEALVELVSLANRCPLCHGTGKRVPSYVNLSDPCPCTQK